MSIATLILVVLIVLMLVGVRRRNRPLVIISGGLLFGTATFVLAGLGAARLLGEGRFYVVPFGGYRHFDDLAVYGSLAFWVLTWAASWWWFTARWHRLDRDPNR